VIIHKPLLYPPFPFPFASSIMTTMNPTSDKKAGDGTTTSVLMTQAIVNQGIRFVKSGVNPEAIRRGIQKTANLIADKLLANARWCDVSVCLSMLE